MSFPSPRPELLALLNAVKAEPDDDTAKLVLADWLQEQPGPADVARGEWLRLRVGLDRVQDNDPARDRLEHRLGELVEGYESAWARPLADTGFRVEWAESRWGLLTVRAELGQFANDRGIAAAATEAFAWVGTLRVTARHGGGYTRFCDGPFLDQVIALDLTGFARNFLPVPELANNDRVGRLVELDLSGTLAGERDGAVYLASTPHLGALRRLGMNRCNTGDRGFAALISSPHLSNLRRLDVAENGLSIHAARAFADSGHLPALVSLDLTANRLGPDGTLILIAYPPAGRLRELRLGANGAADYGAEQIARYPHLDQLTHLDLSNNLLTNRAAVALAAADHLKSLEMLDLQRNGITAEGARVLAGSLHLDGLRELDLRNNPIGLAGADALRERFGDRVRVD